MTAPDSTPAAAAPYPAAGVAWYSVGVLLIAYTIAFIDRTILALLVGPIQRDLAISDTAMGLLHGIAFALFYCALGIPIARLSDQHSRRWIIVIGMAIWSGMTALCGIARNFWELFLARIGVGVGEAALSPAAYSMIADMFPPQKLGRALSIYSSGVFFGAGLAFMIGGTVVGAIQSIEVMQLPLVGEVRAWQAVFFIVGLPGLLFALLMLTVPEPDRRRSVGGVRGGTPDRPGVAQLSAYLREHAFIITCHFLGFSLLGVVFNGFIAWTPTQLIRDFGVSASEAGRALGLVIFLFGGSGIIAGGLLADYLARRGRLDASMLAGIAGGVGLVPACIAAPLMPGFSSAVVMYALFFFFASFPFGAAATALQIMTPADLRARLSAIYLLTLNLLGIGGGPVMIAVISDSFLGGKSDISIAMAITGSVVTPLGVIVLIVSLARFRERVRMVNAANAASR